MAEQKQKLSRSRSRKRRSQDKVSAIKLVNCIKCKSPIPAHTVCPVCGNYKNQQVVKIASVKTSVKSKSKKKDTEDKADSESK